MGGAAGGGRVVRSGGRGWGVGVGGAGLTLDNSGSKDSTGAKFAMLIAFIQRCSLLSGRLTALACDST